jgi:uncharacterized protein with HEPN domain
MPPSTGERLDHILDAIDQIAQSTSSLTFEEFEKNRILRWGIERGLEIVSEASRSIPEELKAMHPATPWRSVADFGNRLRHAYHDVDLLIVWKILQNDLISLRETVLLLKAKQGDS